MLDLLSKRRSIRVYKDTKVEEDKIKQLIKAALLSPTSKNSRPWEFIVITEGDTIEKLAKSKPTGVAFIKDAPLLIAVLANPEKSTVWIEDASIAATIIHLEAEALGLGSCWIQIRERDHNDQVSAEDYVRGILEVPENIRVEALISIGYPNEVKKPYNDEDLPYDKVYREKYLG